MIDALEKLLDAGSPVEAVIERGDTEEQQRGGHKYRRAPLSCRAVSQHNQDNAGSDCQGEGAGVDPATPRGLHLDVRERLGIFD